MKKILNVFLALLALVSLTACFAVNEVTSIEFTNAPSASYEQGVEVEAEDFSVIISFQFGDSLTLKLTDPRLTVTGLNGDLLDTRTIGRKTINISYQGFSVSVSYEVEGVYLTYWDAEDNRASTITTLETFESHSAGSAGIRNEAELAQFAYLVNQNPSATRGKTYSLLGTYTFDLSAHEWIPITGFAGTLDGGGAIIKGLKISDGTDELPNKGFIGSTDAYHKDNNPNAKVIVKNLTFEEVFINSVTDGLGETNKNFAAVIGKTECETEITNVIVKNSIFVSHGRLAAIVGQSNGGKLTITNSKSLYNIFTAVNGYAAKSADGNGDKVAGLVGQAQKEIIITNSSVENVTVNGTRDLGGLIGFAGAKTTLVNNNVDNTIIQASVPGGMLPTKGTRSLGVFIGTIQSGENSSVEFGADNTYSNVQTLSNTNYQELSVKGVLFGGIRSTSNTTIRKAQSEIKIGDNTYLITTLVSPNADNIPEFAAQVAEITEFLLAVYNGESPAVPTAKSLIKVELKPVA
ncbi:MAG TPA: hypothetical protein GX708_07100 [Gallicola sp.]|jgi:hypothetical protein|nr:hypothetical protein [Gallicola sp.]